MNGLDVALEYVESEQSDWSTLRRDNDCRPPLTSANSPLTAGRRVPDVGARRRPTITNASPGGAGGAWSPPADYRGDDEAEGGPQLTPGDHSDAPSGNSRTPVHPDLGVPPPGPGTGRL